MGFVIGILASSITLVFADVPEIAKDGLRLTTFICVVGLVCLGIHFSFKKILGE